MIDILYKVGIGNGKLRRGCLGTRFNVVYKDKVFFGLFVLL